MSICSNSYNQIIKLYPLIVPKLYVWLRSKILPIDMVEELLPKSGNILDVGCGYGFTTIYFALKSKTRQMTGLEINPHRIKIAKIAAQGINNVRFFSRDLATNEHHKYQTIVLIDLLHHLTSVQKKTLLSQCYRLLPKKGLLIIKDINTRPLIKYYWNYLHDLVMTKFRPLYFLEASELIKLGESSSYSIKKHFSLNNFFYPHHLYEFVKK